MQSLSWRLMMADWLAGGAATACAPTSITLLRPIALMNCFIASASMSWRASVTRVDSRYRMSGLHRHFNIRVGQSQRSSRFRHAQHKDQLRFGSGFGHIRASKPSRRINWCQNAINACNPASPKRAYAKYPCRSSVGWNMARLDLMPKLIWKRPKSKTLPWYTNVTNPTIGVTNMSKYNAK